MLSNAPLAQPYRVAHRFGDNSAEHDKILINGVPLLGHEGLDLAAPPGTAVLAVQDGNVLRVEENHPRYGKVVLLGHEWGQSLYAQLGKAAVQAGAAVQGGKVIGAVGSTGQAGPHLHFGLRIRPFAVDDGWVGNSDPAPYLDRLTLPRGAVLGPHIIGGVHPHLELLRRWQPRLITVLDPNPDEMALLRTACPQAVIVGRIFVTDSDVETRIRADPEAAAQWAHELTMRQLTPHVNYWQVANEVLASPADLPLLARFEIKRMQLAAAAMYFCAIFAFSVGTPDLPVTDRMGLWRLLYPAHRTGGTSRPHRGRAPVRRAGRLEARPRLVWLPPGTPGAAPAALQEGAVCRQRVRYRRADPGRRAARLAALHRCCRLRGAVGYQRTLSRALQRTRPRLLGLYPRPQQPLADL